MPYRRLTNALRDCKAASHDPEGIRLEKPFARSKGVYVPSLYDVQYTREDGTIKSFAPLIEADVPATVCKRFVDDLENAFYPTAPPVPYTQVIHDRIVLEIMRGCTQRLPVLPRGDVLPPRARTQRGKAFIPGAGDGGQYRDMRRFRFPRCPPAITRICRSLCERLTEQFKDQHVSLSLPSLRIDSVLKGALEHTQNVRKSSLTFAPEAGTQRLRDVINKGVTQDDLMEKLQDAFENGWNSVKLYFMMGLPTETMEDLEGIAKLAKAAVDTYYAVPKPQRAKGLRITVSASVFVPKPFHAVSVVRAGHAGG